MAGSAIDAATVRYQVRDVDRAVRFYAGQLGFQVERRSGPFVQVSRGALVMILSGPGTSGARDMPDGRKQQPGGWNRIIVWVDDLRPLIAKLREEGVPFRNEIETGPGGSQVLVEDPDGNPVELHQAAAGEMSGASGTR